MNLEVYKHTFEGRALTTIMYRGRPCWIARDVGSALGYSRGGDRFADKIRGEWKEEFIDGRDVVLVTGSDLHDLRALLEVSPESGESSLVSRFAPCLLLLFESGLHLAMAKTTKPAGRQLRRFLVDEVLPQLVRDGRYSPDRQVVDGRIVERNDRALDVKERELAIRERELAADSLWRLHAVLEAVPGLAPGAREAIAYAAAEAASGRNLSALKPAAGEEASWLTPTEIAAKLGVSLAVVGRYISVLGLKGPGDSDKERPGVPGISRKYVNKAKGIDRTVYSFVYSPRAENFITRFAHGNADARFALLAEAKQAVSAALQQN